MISGLSCTNDQRIFTTSVFTKDKNTLAGNRIQHFFYHPDCYCRRRNFTGSVPDANNQGVAGCTAGREFSHGEAPCPEKMLRQIYFFISIGCRFLKFRPILFSAVA